MLLLILIWYLIEVSQCTTIKVDPVNGTNDQTCWNGGVSCKTLNYALGGVNNSTIMQLSNGTIDLSSSNTTLSNLSNITMVGTGITSTTIKCTNSNAGLYFVGINNLTIANLTISNCSMIQNSTTWNNSSPVQYLSAVTVYYSSDLTIQSVSFSHNNGIGLTIINTGGFVRIYGSIFDNNYITNDDHPGGGGLYIEFPFCLLNEYCDYSEPSSNFLNNNAYYTVDSCNFTNNIAKKVRSTSQFFSKTYTEPTFGHGGGMSVFFRGNSTENTINISNSKFVHNTAVWGGGLFIEFGHRASKNTISIKENSQFATNRCHDNDNPEDPGGGGVQVFYRFYSRKILPKHNSVSFCQSYFVFNTAYWGGGVGYSLGKEHYAHGTNLLYFFNCSWYGNSAKFGAAVDLYRPLGTAVAHAVTFENCSFVSNTASYHLQIDQFELQGAGIMYANSIAIDFKGFVEFSNNSGTALVLFTSYIDVMDECTVIFKENKGWRGGAVSLLASSWIKVGENTTVKFDRNHAGEVGGAIYTELVSEHKVVPQWNCFIQFSDPSYAPDDWKTKIQFEQNYAVFGGHAIYATTLHSCVWDKNSGPLGAGDIKSAFHWKSFEFDGESGTHNFSREEIATATNNLTTCQSIIEVSPGEKYHLPFKHLDDEGHNASVVFFVQSDDTRGSIDYQSIYVYGDILQVYGAPNTNFNITVTSLAPIPYTVTLNVTFDYCPPGYIAYKKGNYDNSTSCKCGNLPPDGFPGISECNDTLYQAYITRYHWGGIHGPSGKFVTAVCPQGYCSFTKSEYTSLLPKKRSDLDYFQCQKQHRTGEICGECMSGYGISSQSNCVKCTHGTLKGLGLFFLYECLPTIIFVSFILIFNVNITSGYWNSLIFYFQIVESLNLYALQSTEEYPEGFEVLINIHKYTFGIWNLEYYSPDVCYISGIKNVFALYALQYVTVLIAFGLIFVLIVIKPRNYLRGLATVLVLSYTKLAFLSMKFFVPGKLHSSYDETIEYRVHLVGTMKYFHGEHLYYALPAMVILFFSAMFPFCLILKLVCQVVYWKYQYEWCNKCDKFLDFCRERHRQMLKQFLQAFYGSFKDDCIFYGGFFFVYRLALYATFAFTPSLMIQYCVQQCLLGFFLFVHCLLQPYNTPCNNNTSRMSVPNISNTRNDNNSNNKNDFAFANKLDALVFMNLIVINALSVYNFYSVIDIQSQSQVALAVQLIFIYLPLLYIPFRVIWYYRSRQARARNDAENNTRNRQLDNLPNAGPGVEDDGHMDDEQRDSEKARLLAASAENSGYDAIASLTRIDHHSTTNSTNASYRRPAVDKVQNAS